MNVFKRTFGVLKKKFFQLFILEFLFILSNFFFLLFVKNKIKDYLNLIQNIPADIGNEPLIANLDNVVQSGLIFAFFLVPLAFTIIWIFFQSLVWMNIKDDIKNKKKYLINFAIISIILITLFLFIIYNIMSTNIAEFADSSLILLIIIFIFYFIITSSYLTLRGEKFVNDIKIICKSFKKSIRLLHFILLAFIVSMSLFFLFMVLFSSYLIDDFFFLPPAALVIYIIIIILINLLVKVILNIKISEIK